jgi:hypothetical protein
LRFLIAKTTRITDGRMRTTPTYRHHLHNGKEARIFSSARQLAEATMVRTGTRVMLKGIQVQTG